MRLRVYACACIGNTRTFFTSRMASLTMVYLVSSSSSGFPSVGFHHRWLTNMTFRGGGRESKG